MNKDILGSLQQKTLERLNRQGIDELNPMQQAVGTAFRETEGDILVLSPTGSGKTLAYLLPLIEKMDADSNSVQAVVIVPGRELAMQSAQVLAELHCGIRAYACYGGRATMDEHRELRKVLPHIIFATPGRLNDHLDKENIQAADIRYLVIDEFDKCLQMGFYNEMSRLLRRLQNVRRRILLSATEAEGIPDFIRLEHARRLDFLNHEEQVSSRVHIYKVHSPSKDKLETLRSLLLGFGASSSIVFLNYRDAVERVASYLSEEGFTVSLFHGGLEQKQREDALYKFSNGSANVMVGTDLASRGLDIPNIEHIVHYHLPEGEDGYVHRVGRTARWDARGNAYFVLGPEEQVPEYVTDVVADYPLVEAAEDQLPPKPLMATVYIGKGKKDKLSKGDIVGFLCKKGGLKSDEIGRIDVNERFTYVAVRRERVGQMLRLVSGEKIKGLKTLVEMVK